MLTESLDELLFTARCCLKYRKIDNVLWPPPHAMNGVLGIPAAIALFTIVDALGSYFKKNKNVSLHIQIDGQLKNIGKQGYHHYYILNSEYFGLSLSENDIEKIYSMGRSRLMHNAILGKEVTLRLSGTPFLQVNPFDGKGRFVVNLKEFSSACENAIAMFKAKIDDIVPYSPEGRDFKKSK